jgi:primosomal protein N' (replication factor Y)
VFECGYIEECPRCDTSLVLHKTINLLKCHHCSYQKTQPQLCSERGSNNAIVGKGTQQLEEGLKEQFPNEKILRIDRDTTRSQKKRELAMELAHSGKVKILIGTQMLTKGHDFPNLSMVAIINADQGLFGSNFRSSELFAQHYFQASGRAGRRNERGLVVIQTHNPNHPLLQNIINNNYNSFFDDSIEERINHLWPPFYGAALLRAEAVNKKKVFELLSKISSFSETLKKHKTLFLGPISSPIEKKLGKYRGQILLLNKNRKTLHSTLKQVSLFIENNDIGKGVRWVIDIDPIDMS